MIYFIRAGKNGPIKIGFTGKRKVGRRLSSLQTSTATRLRVLCFIFGCEKQEAAEHRRFEYARIRGKWFKPVPELLDHIDRLRGTKYPQRGSLLGKFLRRYGLEGEPCRTVPELRRLAILAEMIQP